MPIRKRRLESWDWFRRGLMGAKPGWVPARPIFLPSKNSKVAASGRTNGAGGRVNPDPLCFCFLVPNCNLPEWSWRWR
jgi:hypothetical protein